MESLLDRPDQWRYGYEISKVTGLRSGTLYPLLMRLSDRGLLEADWHEPEQPGRPPRHVHRLTPDGIALARQLRASVASQAGNRKLARGPA